jgi:hypothetical protein
MGTWFKKPRPVKEEKHYHSLPVYKGDEDIIPGDRYQCECGAVLEITTVNPNDGFLGWKRVYTHGIMRDTRLDMIPRLPGESEQSYMEIR